MLEFQQLRCRYVLQQRRFSARYTVRCRAYRQQLSLLRRRLAATKAFIRRRLYRRRQSTTACESIAASEH
jgi:hypothetical protein